MSNLLAHAKEELRRLRDPSGEPCEMQDAIEANVLKIVRVFASARHSGSSAPYTLGILEKVLALEPVTPLTGNEDEWRALDHGDGGVVAQNKRCGRVFRRADGTAYDIEAVVFRDPDGACFTSRDSRKDVVFPYVPKTEIVDRPVDRPEVSASAP